MEEPPVQQPGHPPPEPPVECVKVPVPSGTVNLLDPAVIAKEIERGEREIAAKKEDEAKRRYSPEE
jgi:hypothetical protein